MAHPLSGADPGTILRAFAAGGAPDRWGETALIAAMAMARAPFSALERLAVGPRLSPPAELPPPVFILGHWRSGTTHLYNIMSSDPGWAYVPPFAVGLPWDMFGLGRAFRPALLNAGVALFEGRPVRGVARDEHGFVLETAAGPVRARRLVLAGGTYYPHPVIDRMELSSGPLEIAQEDGLSLAVSNLSRRHLHDGAVSISPDELGASNHLSTTFTAREVGVQREHQAPLHEGGGGQHALGCEEVEASEAVVGAPQAPRGTGRSAVDDGQVGVARQRAVGRADRPALVPPRCPHAPNSTLGPDGGRRGGCRP